MKLVISIMMNVVLTLSNLGTHVICLSEACLFSSYLHNSSSQDCSTPHRIINGTVSALESTPKQHHDSDTVLSYPKK